MAGPRRDVAPTNTYLAALALATLAGCSFDSVGLGQTTESGPGGSGSSSGSVGSVGSTSEPGSTGAPTSTAGPTTPGSGTGESGGETPGTGESGGSSSGAVDPGASTSSASDSSTGDVSTSTGGTDGTTGDGTSSGGCVEQVFYEDKDGDGYGNSKKTMTVCEAPPNYVLMGEDCNDDDEAMNPGLDEICDGKDNDCDKLKDEFSPGSNLECEGCKMALYNDHVYHFCDAEELWPEAKKGCEGRGATLVQEEDDAEHAWLLSQLPGNSGPWFTGGSAPNEDDKFKWLSGDAIAEDDMRWGWMRPAGGTYVALVSELNLGVWATFNGEWFDRDADKVGRYICESPLPP